MTEKYKPKKGDRVRVVLEGEVSKTHSGGDFDIEGFNFISPWEKHTVSIEKIKPPVEVFQPGDRLREKSMGFEVTLGSNGYLHHYKDGFAEFYSIPKADSFTSKNYELVYRP